MNRALRRISLVVLAMFLLLLLSVNYVQAFEPSSLAVQRGNARVFSQQYQYQRGSILTSNNKTIAESVHVKGIYAYQRSYPDPLVYAPVTGYDSLYSATGIEKTEDKFLSGSDPQLTVHNLIDLVTGKPRRGATVQLTINSAAQTAAYEQLKATGLPSGAVAIDPKTGAILALASYPTFNPNKYATFNSAQLKRTDNRYLNDPAAAAAQPGHQPDLPARLHLQGRDQLHRLLHRQLQPADPGVRADQPEAARHHQGTDQLRQLALQRRQQPDRERQGAAHLRLHRLLQHGVREPRHAARRQRPSGSRPSSSA